MAKKSNKEIILEDMADGRLKKATRKLIKEELSKEKQEIKSEKPSEVISVIDVRTYAYNNNMTYMEAKKVLFSK